MKKLFLLPAIALVAILTINAVCASIPPPDRCCSEYSDGSAPCDWSNAPGGCSVAVCKDPGGCVPEFTSLGMGIALIGAGAGYALIRRKLKK